MLRSIKIVSLCLVVSLGVSAAALSASFFPDSPFSDKAAGTTGAAFLKLPAGARAVALGTSQVAAVADSEAIFWNPAGLARMEEAGLSEASLSYNALLETSYSGSAAYARPFAGRRGVLGAAFVYFSQSAIQGYDTLGNPSDEFTPSDFAFSAAYAKKLSNLCLGGAVKLIRSQIDDASGTTFAMDIGVQAERVTDVGQGALDLGASIRNFGPAIQTGSVSDPLPFKFQAGALWHISPNVNGLLDGHLSVDDDPYVSLGLEANYPFGETMKGSARGGYNVRNTRDIDGLSGLSAGFGLDLSRFRFDYAWVPMGELGTTHRLTLGSRF
ncbi:MAG: PorV/PorQ family protein [Elusimicrobiota bacterium]